jgi:hypothetical protein
MRSPSLREAGEVAGGQRGPADIQDETGRLPFMQGRTVAIHENARLVHVGDVDVLDKLG